MSENPLRTHQQTAAQELIEALDRHRVALDGSDTGTGKTYVACAVIKHYDLPTLAVVPKISMTSWKRVADVIGTSFSVINWEMVRTGRTPFGKWTEEPSKVWWYCNRCFEVSTDPKTAGGCRNDPEGHAWVRKRSKNKAMEFTWDPRVKFLIFDEIHRAGGRDSQNCAMVTAAKRQGIMTLGLSATPAITPMDMKALGYLLDLHKLEGSAGFWPWLRGWGYRPRPLNQGWEWPISEARQNKIMDGIRRIVFNGRGTRVRTEDIPDFPGRDIQPILLDLDDPGKVDELRKLMHEPLDRLLARRRGDKDPNGVLTARLRARQELELLKVPMVVERAQDLLDSGYSVGIFVNFSDTLAEFRKRLGCDCYIDGTQVGDPAARQKCIDDFLHDLERLIVINIKAGGVCVSLQDLLGIHQRVGLAMPCESAVDFRQLVGRFQRDSGKSTALYQIMLAANTCEEQIARKLIKKLGNLDSLLDGDFVPDEFSLHG